MAKTYNEKIEAAKAEIKQKEALIKKFLQQQKAQERKDRNHRLCKRGGLVEKLLPDLIKLSDEQFQVFVDKTLLTRHTKNILAELVPPESNANDNQQSNTNAAHDGNTATTTPAETQSHSETVPTPKPTATAHNVNANNNSKPAQAAKVAG